VGLKIFSDNNGTLILGDPELVSSVVLASPRELEPYGCCVIKVVKDSRIVIASTEASEVAGLLPLEETALTPPADAEAEDK
jgi:anti-sigma factor ChrR (cupin superfamily)